MNDLSNENSKKIADSAFDAIVIGAGIGGLNCAAALSLAGKKVLVLERNPFIGGRCSSYTREGYTVDYCVHAFSLGHNGPLQTLVTQAEQTNLPIPRPLLRWKDMNLTIVYHGSMLRMYSHLNLINLVRMTWQFLRVRGVPWKDKWAFLKISGVIGKATPEYSESLKNVNVMDWLNRFSDSLFVHAIYQVTSDSYAVVPYNKVSAQDYIEVSKPALKSGGTGYPIGGCAAIPNAYKSIIEACGGQVVTSTPVEQVLVDQAHGITRAIGVRLKGGQELKAPAVVSNAWCKDTYYKLLPSSLFPEDLIKKVDRIEPSMASAVLHVAFDKPILKHTLVMKTGDIKALDLRAELEKGHFESIKTLGVFMSIPSNLDPNLAPPGKQLVLAGTGYLPLGVDISSQMKELLLDNIQRLAPSGINIRDHIEWSQIYTPQYYDTLFSETGAVIGCGQQIGQTRENRLDNRTPIQGLYHCGDDAGKNLFGVGTELAAKSGQNCAKILLEDLAKAPKSFSSS